MFEIFAAIFIVRSFYNYAKESGRTGWAYGLLGFVLFYGITLSISIGAIAYLVAQDPYTELGMGTTLTVSLIAILIGGGLTMYVIFPLIKSQHQRADELSGRNTLDQDLFK